VYFKRESEGDEIGGKLKQIWRGEELTSAGGVDAHQPHLCNERTRKM
jgi:hypothetical protein